MYPGMSDRWGEGRLIGGGRLLSRKGGVGHWYNGYPERHHHLRLPTSTRPACHLDAGAVVARKLQREQGGSERPLQGVKEALDAREATPPHTVMGGGGDGVVVWDVYTTPPRAQHILHNLEGSFPHKKIHQHHEIHDPPSASSTTSAIHTAGFN